MYCSVLSATVSGMEMIPVQVEADVSDGMPQFTMVGYVSAQVKEAQDRVRTALKNMGISLPPKRITINLSPADVRKRRIAFRSSDCSGRSDDARPDSARVTPENDGARRTRP